MNNFAPRSVNFAEMWKKHNGLDAAAFGTLDPGVLAEQVFDKDMESARLFLYLFRRFGSPVDPFDEYKSACAYTLTTPRDDVFLRVHINGSNRASLLFHYAVAKNLGKLIRDEEDSLVGAWHQEFRAWREANNIEDLDWFKGGKETFQQYCATHPGKEDELNNVCGPLKAEANSALLVTLRDLMRPTYIRDVYLNPLGRVKDGDFDYDEDSDTMTYKDITTVEYFKKEQSPDAS